MAPNRSNVKTHRTSFPEPPFNYKWVVCNREAKAWRLFRGAPPWVEAQNPFVTLTVPPAHRNTNLGTSLVVTHCKLDYPGTFDLNVQGTQDSHPTSTPKPRRSIERLSSCLSCPELGPRPTTRRQGPRSQTKGSRTEHIRRYYRAGTFNSDLIEHSHQSMEECPLGTRGIARSWP